jgi:hypothetical protein
MPDWDVTRMIWDQQHDGSDPHAKSENGESCRKQVEIVSHIDQPPKSLAGR